MSSKPRRMNCNVQAVKLVLHESFRVDLSPSSNLSTLLCSYRDHWWIEEAVYIVNLFLEGTNQE